MDGVKSAGLSALQAYGGGAGKVGGALGGGVESSGIGTVQQTQSFADMVTGAIDKVQAQGIETQQQSEAVIAGQGNLVDVVTAIAETEVALETMVSVRDKVISAYEEIMRMPI